MNEKFTLKQFEQVIELAKECGQVILDGAKQRKDVITKEGNGNFVTKYDKMVQDIIEKRLQEICPGSHFEGEESENNEENLEGVLFIVDPIDGTMNFIKGIQWSCVSIGVVVDGKRFAGVVYCPYCDELYTGYRGQGAFLNGEPIHVTDVPLEDALTFCGTSSYYPELNEPTCEMFLKYLRLTSDLRRTGSSTLDLCSLACGRCDFFFELRLCPWDFAAASVIIEEAGGRITTGEGGELTLFEKCSVMACNSAIHLEHL